MTITLFHGSLGLVAAILLVAGAGTILTATENWLRERFTLDLNPYRVHLLGSRLVLKGSLGWDLHICIPRQFKIRLRWDRCGALVRLSDGHEGCILGTFDMDDSPGPIALVQPYGEDGDPVSQCPAWMPLVNLTAVPARSFREFVRYLRNGDA